MTKSDVISTNAFLSSSQMTVNAKYICSYLRGKGWTDNAIAGMLGNMQTESTINPGIWQNLDSGNTSLGFGLVQWTPATKLIEWADGKGLDYKDIDTQLERILYELENGLQYYPTDSYPETFREFSTSTKSAYYLGGAFLYNYERPAEPDAVTRGNQATAWYNVLKGYNDSSGETPDSGSQGSGTGSQGSGKVHKHKLKLIYKYIVTR